MSDSSDINTFLEAWKKMSEHLDNTVAKFEKKEAVLTRKNIERIIKLLIKAKSAQQEIILLGVGRDADILRMFSIRLKQIGFARGQVKVVSEEGPFDFVGGGSDSIAICLSGRGFTSPTAEIAAIYKERGAKLVVITSNRKSQLIGSADVNLIIEGLTPFDLKLGRYAYGPDQLLHFDPKKRHPGPTLFEVAALMVLECIVSSLHFAFHREK